MLFVKLNFHSIVNIADIASEFSDAKFIVLHGADATCLVYEYGSRRSVGIKINLIIFIIL